MGEQVTNSFDWTHCTASPVLPAEYTWEFVCLFVSITRWEAMSPSGAVVGGNCCSYSRGLCIWEMVWSQICIDPEESVSERRMHGKREPR